MKLRTLAFTLAGAVALAFLPASPAAAAGAVGDPAPTFSLVDLAGKTHSLADYKGKAVVLEWVNPNCPFSDRHAREKTMTAVAGKHPEVVWLGINSTNKTHRDFLEPEAHAKWASERGVDYAVLYDPTGEVGKAYGASTTPHLFVIDEQGRIAYNGAVDDDPPGKRAIAQRTNYVDGGLTAHAASKAIDPAATKPYGCSVKY